VEGMGGEKKKNFPGGPAAGLWLLLPPAGDFDSLEYRPGPGAPPCRGWSLPALRAGDRHRRGGGPEAGLRLHRFPCRTCPGGNAETPAASSPGLLRRLASAGRCLARTCVDVRRHWPHRAPWPRCCVLHGPIAALPSASPTTTPSRCGRAGLPDQRVPSCDQAAGRGRYRALMYVCVYLRRLSTWLFRLLSDSGIWTATLRPHWG